MTKEEKIEQDEWNRRASGSIIDLPEPVELPDYVDCGEVDISFWCRQKISFTNIRNLHVKLSKKLYPKIRVEIWEKQYFESFETYK